MAVRRTIFAKGTQPSRDRTLNVLIQDVRKLSTTIDSRLPSIMKGAADIVLRHTLPHVPRRTGALAASGKAEAVPGKNGGWAALVSFGGSSNPVTATVNAPAGVVEYAVFVHEGYGPGARVPAKFLELGGLSARREVEEYILTNLRKIKV